ncbi:MAG: serine/threonine protein kinase [Bacteroidaceae bacterium]
MYLKNNSLLQGGKYQIVRFIGAGGFGCTYEAKHTLLDSRVALKEFFVNDFCNRDEETGQVSIATQSKVELVGKLKKKFIEEARALFQMHHPGIVRVIDIFEENGTAYYVMEYIDGQSLGDLVKQRGCLPEAEAVGYIRQVAEALTYVHGLNRLHLDIKPGNIMLNAEGKAILIDFGASKHYDDETGENTSTLLGVNTKGYAPVEQVNQSFTSFSPATDIYALGATLYKLLTGVTPPPSTILHSEEATLAPLPPSVSAATRKAVAAAMQLLRKNRPQTVTAWLAMLTTTPDAEETEIIDAAEPKPSANPKPSSRPKPSPKPKPAPKQTTPPPMPKSKPAGQAFPRNSLLAAVAILLVAVFAFFLSRREVAPSVDTSGAPATDVWIGDTIDTVAVYDDFLYDSLAIEP